MSKQCVIFQGTLFTQFRDGGDKILKVPNVKVEKIFEGQNETLYLVLSQQKM